MISGYYLVALCAILASSSAHLIVSLDYGTFLGVQDGNLTKFLGIPFSEPVARFQLPKMPKPLHGLQNATEFGPACPQQKLSLAEANHNYSKISEACLTLDVFTPTLNATAKLPVLVWLFPGGWQFGSSADNDFRPAVEHSISLNEPVIIVVPNYRLTAFGFLAGKEASAAGITNLGLQDQIFALEWVQKHISSFGGDPERVVLGGASAGATSTGLLLLHNKRMTAPDLFRGAFTISGTPVPVLSQADGQGHYDGLVAANNCTAAADTLECLRDVPYDTLLGTINATPDLFSYQGLELIWGPRVDGDVVLQNPALSIAQGAFAKIPILTGDDDDEGTIFAYGTSLNSFNITTEEGFLDYVHTVFLPTATPEQMSRVATLYPQDPTQGSPFDTGSDYQLTPEYKRVAAFIGDFMFHSPRRALLQQASKTQDTWSWLNKRGKSTPDNPMAFLGAQHVAELPMFLATDTTVPTDHVAVNALINFVNTLNPNHPAPHSNSKNNSSVFWPKYQTPSADGPSSLLTFSDPLTATITGDTFRANGIQYISELQLEKN
ncbi:sterol esterase [Mycena crocata]|nr:sterol esterase [Mycena crocata]